MSIEELMRPNPEQVKMMKGLWRKYSSKLQGRLQGYLVEEMLYVLAWISGMHDSRANSHRTAITYFTDSLVSFAVRNGFTSAIYLSTAMVETVSTPAFMVIGTIAFPTNNLQIKSPVIPCRWTFVMAKSYKPGQSSNVIRSATAKFISR